MVFEGEEKEKHVQLFRWVTSVVVTPGGPSKKVEDPCSKTALAHGA